MPLIFKPVAHQPQRICPLNDCVVFCLFDGTLFCFSVIGWNGFGLLLWQTPWAERQTNTNVIDIFIVTYYASNIINFQRKYYSNGKSSSQLSEIIKVNLAFPTASKRNVVSYKTNRPPSKLKLLPLSFSHTKNLALSQ